MTKQSTCAVDPRGDVLTWALVVIAGSFVEFLSNSDPGGFSPTVRKNRINELIRQPAAWSDSTLLVEGIHRDAREVRDGQQWAALVELQNGFIGPCAWKFPRGQAQLEVIQDVQARYPRPG